MSSIRTISKSGAPPVIAFFTCSSGDWGGASRVLYTALRQMDLARVQPLILLSGDGPIRQELEGRGIQCVVWGPLTEPVNRIKYLGALLRMIRLLRRERIAVLHVNHRFWRPAEVLAAFLLRIPVLVHFHVVNEQAASFMNHCGAALCVSRYVAKHSLPEDLEKVMIYNSIDVSRFSPGAARPGRWGLQHHHVVVAYLGQIRDIKGVQDFIAMARKLPDRNVRFLIAGECRDPNKYPGSYSETDLVKMIGDDPRIVYVGYVKEVEAVYHAADIVVVPSRWQEPLGLISLEAGACRKPVVATRVGGIPEVIADGENGFLVEAGDVEALAERVGRLIADPGLRSQMGAAGRKRVDRDFTDRPIREFEALLLRYARR